MPALALALLLLPGQALGAGRVWDGGCGADRSWSCAANWKQDVVPGPGDTAAFNAKSTGEAVVDPGFGGEVATVRLAVGFSGRVVLGRSLTVSKLFQQSDGEFAAGEHVLSTKALTVAGGAFEASSTQMSVSGTLKLSGSPEFDANGGTLVVGGADGKLICDGVSFNRVVFANVAKTKKVEPSCDLPLGNDPSLGAGGSIQLNGALSGAGALSSTGTLTLGPTGSLSGFSGLDATNLTVNGSYDFGGYSALSVAERFSLTASGSIVAPAATASFAGEVKIASAAGFDANGGTVVFDGTTNSGISCGDKTFHLVRFEQTGGNKNVRSNCSLPLGEDPVLGGGGATVRVSGALSGSGTLSTRGELGLYKAGRLSGFDGLEAEGDLKLVGATADFGAYAPFSVAGDYGQTSGKVTAPDGADFGGAFVLAPQATFEASPGTTTVGGDFTVASAAKFRANGGTVELTGGNQTIVGSTTFYNLIKVAGEAQTLKFAAGDMQTVEGVLTLKGVSGQLLALASTVPGTPWLLDTEDGSEVEFVSVADSTNVGTPIVAAESKSKGGNNGWTISGPATKFVVEAQTTTPTAGSTDDLTIVAKDANGNASATYTGIHNLTFGPAADSPSGAHATVTNVGGFATDFGVVTPIAFSAGVASVSGGKNGAMALVKAGPTSIVVSDGSISNGSGLAVAVSPGAAARLAWTNPTSTGTLSSPCLFTCAGDDLGMSGYFTANVSVTDSLGNVVSDLGPGHKVSVGSNRGKISGGALDIASSGPAESTSQLTFTPTGNPTAKLTAETTSGATYTDATASMKR